MLVVSSIYLSIKFKRRTEDRIMDELCFLLIALIPNLFGQPFV